MKNIHILPTKKPSIPSRLFYKERELIFSKDYHVFNGVNIYITSDEEIKDGDWVYSEARITSFGGRWKTQKHAMKMHSYFLVFKKTKNKVNYETT